MWITNVLEVADALKLADRRYAEARQRAINLPLAEKVAAYRQAKVDREAAYAEAIRSQH